MAYYDYKEGKRRIKDILDDKLEVIETEKIPTENSFTFENGYYCWVSAIFVDIRDSSTLFANEDKEVVSKIVRSFSSEIIEIFRDDENLREIGIRGDCVYSIYTTPKKNDVYEIAEKAFYVNTYLEMLNKLLEDKNFPTIKVGIGVATNKELVVKAGRKGTGINSKVWIGDAVSKAANLSSLGNRDGNRAIIFSPLSYDNFIEALLKENERAKEWFTKKHNLFEGDYYEANVIIIPFRDWIDNGMPD